MADELNDDAPPSLRDSLESAFTEAGDGVTQTEAPVEAKAGQPRDETGKFAPKADGAQVSAAQTIPTDPPAIVGQEAPVEPIRPPASWSAQAKADFATLAPHIQSEVLKREGDVAKGFEERAAQLKRYEPLEAVIAPHRDRIHMAGVDEASYVRSLIAADEMLRGPNQLQALLQVAQMYGIDPRSLAQPGQAQQQPQAQLPPELQAALKELNELKATVTQQQTATQQAEQAQTQAEIEAFAKDHLYFDNVKPAMAALLKTGQASNLDEAYDMACWARPEIRPLLQKEQVAKAATAASAKASEARRASGSITGSPIAGGAAVTTGNPLSIRASLEQQLGAS